jgi:hypothetical protein
VYKQKQKTPIFIGVLFVLNNNAIYLIHSKPVYGTKAAGIRIPSAVWWFSNNEATILGKAKALPFKVWANCVFPSWPLMRHFKRLAWKVSKLEVELTSNHLSCAAEKTSKSYVNALVNPMSPPHNRKMR